MFKQQQMNKDASSKLAETQNQINFLKRQRSQASRCLKIHKKQQSIIKSAQETHSKFQEVTDQKRSSLELSHDLQRRRVSE
jgi:ATP-dependent 26S proteasome regulatory subunit